MMTAQLAKSYAPAETEPEVRSRWDRADAFHAEPGPADQAYCILIPPPNVTAALHLGHAFNNTLQDVLVRYHRMQGRNTLWMPGTDHAGIATQTVVEKRLEQQNIKRVALGREAFVERVQAWKDEYEATIIEQLKAIGCSCDWARTRFTMDPMCARAVRAAFFRFFADGLIYRGKRLVNWDPVTLTALADDEVEMKEVAGHMWYLRYPVVGENTTVTVATTRPETMLGDTAVAVNPKDPRAGDLVGKMVKLPIVDREIPIIADDYVVMPGDPDNPMAEYASGFLKVTPAHDPNDWEIGVRHDLQVINVMAPDGSISAEHGWSDVETPSSDAGALLEMSRDDARQRVVDTFKSLGLLEKIRDYTHSVGHSYRSHAPIEPYLSDQWYVRVTDPTMAGEALRAMDHRQYEGDPPPRADGSPREGDDTLRFYPSRYAKMFQAWHENLRDWCISRQLWWGHRIPVWTLAAEDEDHPIDLDAWRAYARKHPDDVALQVDERLGGTVYICVAAGAESVEAELASRGFVQDPDVLDTWFSSGLWPISTMGWPRPEDFPETVGLLDTFNPSSVLCTARDIITLWVSRMVMFNRRFRDGKLPFDDVYIHPMIQDGHGQRMSKSRGNGVDPRDIIHTHGGDALRFVLVQMATTTQDSRLPVDMMCPHCDETFEPKSETSRAGDHVAASEQTCPKCKGGMVSAFGVAAGMVEPSDDRPMARNSSRRFDAGRNFANKLWNAARFALSKLETPGADGEAGLMDRWILTRLHETMAAIDRTLSEYQFSSYAELMYDLVKRDFCDWYLEAIKPTVADNAAQQQVLRTMLNAILRLLHPICPFVTETLWPHVQAAGAAGLPGVDLGPAADPDILATAPWPRVDNAIVDEAAAATVERLQSLTSSIRNLRSEHQVPPRKRITLLATPAVADLVASGAGTVETLAGLDTVGAVTDNGADGSVAMTFEGDQVLLVGLVEAVDADAERERLGKLTAQHEKSVAGFKAKLANENYVKKAPAHLVEETRERLKAAESDLEAARLALQQLTED